MADAINQICLLLIRTFDGIADSDMFSLTFSKELKLYKCIMYILSQFNLRSFPDIKKQLMPVSPWADG